MYTTIKQDNMPRFSGYDGKRQYVVRHPSHGMITVYAPDEYGALRVAAEEWGERFQDFGFYGPARVAKIGR